MDRQVFSSAPHYFSGLIPYLPFLSDLEENRSVFPNVCCVLIFLLLHYYAVSVDLEPTFRDYLSVSSSRVKPLLGQLDP